MGYREDYKIRFQNIAKRVIKHDAPVEFENDLVVVPPHRHALPVWLGQYVQGMIHLIMNEPLWPRYPRRKDVICPVTGEETNHPFGLTGRAWDLIDKGVTYEQNLVTDNAARKIFCFHYTWGRWLLKTARKTEGPYSEGYKPMYPDTKEENWPDVSSLILNLIGRDVRRGRVPYDKTPEDMGWVWLPYEPFDRLELREGAVNLVLLTCREAEIIRLLITASQWNRAEVEQKARDEGSNLLLALARSPDAVEKFNAVRDSEVK